MVQVPGEQTSQSSRFHVQRPLLLCNSVSACAAGMTQGPTQSTLISNKPQVASAVVRQTSQVPFLGCLSAKPDVVTKLKGQFLCKQLPHRSSFEEASPASTAATTASDPPSPKPEMLCPFTPARRIISNVCRNSPPRAQREARQHSVNNPAFSHLRPNSPHLHAPAAQRPSMLLVGTPPQAPITPNRTAGSNSPSISPRARQRYKELSWKARVCFLKFDVTGRGLLDFHQFVECLEHLSDSLKLGRFTKREAGRFFRRFDADKDQQLNHKEFERLYHHLHLISSHTHEPTTFNREMLISRREGHPSNYYDDMVRLGDGCFGSVKKVMCKKTGAKRVIKTVDIHRAVKSGMPPDRKSVV